MEPGRNRKIDVAPLEERKSRRPVRTKRSSSGVCIPTHQIDCAASELPLGTSQTVGITPASAGYHAQDGTAEASRTPQRLTFRIGGRSESQIRALLASLGSYGFAAWYRKPGHDGWPSDEAPHIHAVYAGCAMKAALDEQVGDYRAGRNGLSSHTRYVLDREPSRPRRRLQALEQVQLAQVRKAAVCPHKLALPLFTAYQMVRSNTCFISQIIQIFRLGTIAYSPRKPLFTAYRNAQIKQDHFHQSTSCNCIILQEIYWISPHVTRLSHSTHQVFTRRKSPLFSPTIAIYSYWVCVQPTVHIGRIHLGGPNEFALSFTLVIGFVSLRGL